MSISKWCRDSNPQPSEHESTSITTRPGLLKFPVLPCYFDQIDRLVLVLQDAF